LEQEIGDEVVMVVIYWAETVLDSRKYGLVNLQEDVYLATERSRWTYNPMRFEQHCPCGYQSRTEGFLQTALVDWRKKKVTFDSDYCFWLAQETAGELVKFLCRC
jgi:hypothetical protein